MEIPILGLLQPDASIPEWLVSAPIAVPLFEGQELTFTLDDLPEDCADVADAAVRSFLALGPENKSAASPHIYKNYLFILKALGPERMECEINSADDVWKHIQISEIIVCQNGHGNDSIYIQVLAECDWESEHGLQLVYRGGHKLTRVSEQDGHVTHSDGYGLPDSEDRISRH